MAEGDSEDLLDEAELGELIRHLETEEEASRQGTLSSVESLQVWAATHPALRQMVIVESFAEIGPMILRLLRTLLGLDKDERDGDSTSANGGN